MYSYAEKKQAKSASPRYLSRPKCAAILTALLLLFCLRVLGQIEVACFHPTFLPPMHEWMSGLISYQILLPAQILIILLFAKVCLDFWRASGLTYVIPSKLANFLHAFGRLYLVLSILRYPIQMALIPQSRWLGGCIPIIFHIVLASFIVVYSRYQLRSLPIKKESNE